MYGAADLEKAVEVYSFHVKSPSHMIDRIFYCVVLGDKINQSKRICCQLTRQNDQN